MGRIKSRNTKPELLLRSILHKNGYRFRLHRKDLPGKPDIVLPKYKTAIFVHGCFWHRHPNCKYTTTPKTGTESWLRKFRDNVDRDTRNRSSLIEAGWKVIVVWECAITKKERLDPEELCDIIVAGLKGPDENISISGRPQL